MTLKLEEKTYRVPRGSAVKVATSRVSGSNFFLNGRVDKGSATKKRWSHSDLSGKSVQYSASESGKHLVRVTVAFTGTHNSSVKVEVSVTKPDGSGHGSPWTVTFTGKKGDSARAKIRVYAK